MNRTSIINILLKHNQGNKYLEIGVYDGANFNSVNCKYKIGVDPDLSSKATMHLKSDEFFNISQEKFDLIFIDGLHHYDQVMKDINNSLSRLNDNGIIVCHDMNPEKEEHQIIPYSGGIWNGDCWKAFVQLRRLRPDLEMFVIDADYGCAVIKKGNQEVLKIDEEVNWENLIKNRKKWLNLISTSEFIKKFSNEVSKYEDLKELLYAYVNNPEKPEHNYNLGTYYENIGQTASALSYFLRTAERTKDELLQYECLIRSSTCFEKQGCRNFTVKGLLQHALAMQPKRPEAYYLLSKFHERENKDGSWQECYTISSIGEKVSDLDCKPIGNIGYSGKYALLFQKAISSWWCGLCKESSEILKDLLVNYKLDEIHRSAVINNLQNLKQLDFNKEINYYKKDKYEKLKFKFKNSENIEQNFSEAYQDIFILTMLNGKQNGTYLEIGSADPFKGNNTALLEKQFNWNGISLDIDKNFVENFSKNRKNLCLQKDATSVDYEEILSDMSKNIDYLQIDCDPPQVTYEILLKIPFEEYKFAVVTYEHDYYLDETKSFKELSRKYLNDLGYITVVGDVAPDDWRDYEDWWVHPDLIDEDTINKVKKTSSKTISAEKIMLNIGD
jgi:hypothetical protein